MNYDNHDGARPPGSRPWPPSHEGSGNGAGVPIDPVRAAIGTPAHRRWPPRCSGSPPADVPSQPAGVACRRARCPRAARRLAGPLDPAAVGTRGANLTTAHGPELGADESHGQRARAGGDSAKEPSTGDILSPSELGLVHGNPGGPLLSGPGPAARTGELRRRPDGRGCPRGPAGRQKRRGSADRHGTPGAPAEREPGSAVRSRGGGDCLSVNSFGLSDLPLGELYVLAEAGQPLVTGSPDLAPPTSPYPWAWRARPPRAHRRRPVAAGSSLRSPATGWPASVWPAPGLSSAAVTSGAPVADPFSARNEFPALQQRVHGKPLVWLDNAATTQKPQCVIDASSDYYEHDNSNVHRAAHALAARATRRVRGAPAAKSPASSARPTDARSSSSGARPRRSTWSRRAGVGEHLGAATRSSSPTSSTTRTSSRGRCSATRRAPCSGSSRSTTAGDVDARRRTRRCSARGRSSSPSPRSRTRSGPSSRSRTMTSSSRTRAGPRVLVDGAQAVATCRSTCRLWARLLRLLRAQDLRPDRDRRALRPAGAARRDAALAGRREHDHGRHIRADDVRRAAPRSRPGRRTIAARLGLAVASSSWTGVVSGGRRATSTS